MYVYIYNMVYYFTYISNIGVYIYIYIQLVVMFYGKAPKQWPISGLFWRGKIF